MDDLLKIVIAGLDNAGKTSILTALNKKYDFHKDIISLTPTIRVEYHAREFLKKKIIFWDLGGQVQYRKLYEEKQDIYFADTDLLIYIIDIQDEERFETSLDYLKMIITHLVNNQLIIPVIISFHKFDPEIYTDDTILHNIEILKQKINSNYPSFNILYQQTSIYDIISIVQLVSYGLSVFDERFFNLSELLELYLIEFGSKSLILFDKNGIIISEYYNEVIESDIYIEFIESIKEHLFLLKRMQEESYETEYTITSIGEDLISYLHRIELQGESLFVSVIIRENLKESFLIKFSDFVSELTNILNPILIS